MRWRFVDGDGDLGALRFCSGEREDRGSSFGEGEGECFTISFESSLVTVEEMCSELPGASGFNVLSSSFMSAIVISVFCSVPFGEVVSVTLVVCASALLFS